jgi:hypothetical protein
MVPEARRKVAANYAEERYTSKSNPVKARIQSGASLYLRLKAGAHPGSDGEITMWKYRRNFIESFGLNAT